MSKRAFLFPGQGAQYVGMGKDLAEHSPAARGVFQRASLRLGVDLATICFEGPEESLTRTDYQQPAILTHALAAVEALRAEHGDDAVRAELAAGLSLGEYGALVFAGVLELEDGVYLVRKRGEYMQAASEAYPSGMAAVMKLTAEQLEPLCQQAAQETGEHCILANLLGEKSITISGGKQAVERAVELVKEQRGRGLVLDVAGAFHSPYMQPAQESLAAEIERTQFHPPRIPIVCNVDAEPTTDVERLRANLVKQLTSPVQWAKTVERLNAESVADYVEPGPGGVLTGGLKRTHRDARTRKVDTKSDLDAFNNQ